MWISWSPFHVTKWDKLTSSDEIRKALMKEAPRALGTDDPDQARALIQDHIVDELASKLWAVVMSEKQERLVPLDDWRGVVAKYYSSNPGSSW